MPLVASTPTSMSLPVMVMSAPRLPVAFDDGRVPTFPFEIVRERLCRRLAKGAVGEAEVTLPSP